MSFYNTATTLQTDKSNFFHDNTSSTINNSLLPSLIQGEGNKKNLLLPFSLSGRRGWGMRAIHL